jgi:hypothetical protein
LAYLLPIDNSFLLALLAPHTIITIQPSGCIACISPIVFAPSYGATSSKSATAVFAFFVSVNRCEKIVLWIFHDYQYSNGLPQAAQTLDANSSSVGCSSHSQNWESSLSSIPTIGQLRGPGQYPGMSFSPHLHPQMEARRLRSSAASRSSS